MCSSDLSMEATVWFLCIALVGVFLRLLLRWNPADVSAKPRHLPDACVHAILSFAEPTELAALTEVNKQWRAVGLSERLWRNACQLFARKQPPKCIQRGLQGRSLNSIPGFRAGAVEDFVQAADHVGWSLVESDMRMRLGEAKAKALGPIRSYRALFSVFHGWLWAVPRQARGADLRERSFIKQLAASNLSGCAFPCRHNVHASLLVGGSRFRFSHFTSLFFTSDHAAKPVSLLSRLLC